MNWQTKKLGEICDFQRGLTYSKRDEVEFSHNVVLRANNIGLDNTLNFSELKYIKEEINISENKKVQKGAMIICTASGSKNHLGKVAIIDENYGYAFGGFMGQIIPRKEIDSRYLFYIFTSDDYKNHINKLSDGVNINNLKFDDFKNFEISLPPFSEQKRIVKILDEIFEGIENAKKNAEKNLQNSRELFESHLENFFASQKKGWKKEKLKNVTLKIGSGSTPRGGKSSYKTNGISLVRSMNVHDRRFKEKNLAFIDDMQAKNLSNVILEKDDVLLNITGASVARCCVFPEKYLPARVNQHVSIIRSKKEIINPAFLNYVLTSKYCKDQLLGIGEQGSTRQAITKAQLENFVISFPELLKQKSIVEKLDALSAETKKLEAIYKQKIADLDELKKSVLKKAFNGEL